VATLQLNMVAVLEKRISGHENFVHGLHGTLRISFRSFREIRVQKENRIYPGLTLYATL
jgi:hypothetical protein